MGGRTRMGDGGIGSFSNRVLFSIVKSSSGTFVCKMPSIVSQIFG